MIFSFTINNGQAFAASNSNSTKESAINIAKGVAALFILNRAYNYIDTLSENRSQNENEVIIREETGTRTGSISSAVDLRNKVIVIDPGHGGHDPGAVGPRGLKESEVNLDIALKLYEILTQNTRAKVYLTRDKDIFIPLHERSKMAKDLGADIFLSVHINADETGLQTGIETYAHYSTSPDSWALAWYIQDSLLKELRLADRGLKADNFHVIRETADLKSILLEIGFISNSREEIFLTDPNNRRRAAEAIYHGILEYYDKS